MEKLIVFADVANLILAVPAIVLALKLVMRTEKCLDTAAKFFLASVLIALAAALLTMNKYFGIISADLILIWITIFRLLFLITFIWALYFLLKIVDGGCKNG